MADYKFIIESNEIPFKKTCHCGGVYTEVFESKKFNIQVRVMPRTQNKRVQIKLYGRMKYVTTLNDLSEIDELIKKAIWEN